MPYIIGAFFVALLGVSFWHISQNNRLYRHWQKHLDSNTAHFLSQFAWIRTAQVIGAIAAAILAILVVNNLQLAQQNAGSSATNQAMATKLEELSKAQQQQMQLLQDQQNKIQQILTQASAQRIAPQERVAQVTVSAQAVPASPNAQGGMPNDTIGADIADRIESQARPVTLSDVYNPEQASSDKQSNMDAIKKRYEGLLVNYLFLKKCGLVNPQDYHTIISTLAREMASVNAPGRMENDILTAAQGSYNEMYSKSACSGPEIKPLYNQYTDYIKTISGNMPPQLVGKTPPQ